MTTESVNQHYIFDVQLDNLFEIDEIVLNNVEKAASMVALRAPRFCEGFDVRTEIIRLYNKYFGSAPHLEEHGLMKYYNDLKNEIIQNPTLISLVLCGINMKDTLINNYTREDRTRIQLTIASISRCLIRMYFTKYELDKTCRACPNFNIYFKES